MDGKIPLRSGKPFMLRQVQHERLAGRFCDFGKLFLTKSLVENSRQNRSIPMPGTSLAK